MVTAVKRFSKAEDQPSEAEEALLFWVNQSLHALRFNYALTLACLVRVDLDFVSCRIIFTSLFRTRLEEEATNNDVAPPKFSKLQDLSDFSDGVGLTAVAALYCPEDLLWTEIAMGDPPSMSDSLCNIQVGQSLPVGQAKTFFAALPAVLQRLIALQHLPSVN